MENTKKMVAEFKKRLSIEVRRQKKLDLVEEQDFRKEELSERDMAKILYKWNNRKFEKEYLRKLERN